MKGVLGHRLARILVVSASLIELRGGVLSRKSLMALAISALMGGADQGPGGGVKDSLWAVCQGSPARLERPSELMDWI